MTDSNAEEIRLTGISGSPGICIGKAYLMDREGVNVVEKYFIPKDKLPNEINRFKAAVKKAKDEVGEIIAKAPEDLQPHVNILETHMALYKDKMLYGRTIHMIETEMVNAEWALKKVVSDVRAMFRSITDPYLRGREADITHVADSVMRNLVGGDAGVAGIDKRVILVAHDLSPADTAQIQLDRVKGFMTDRGGKASHTGIIARTLGIPCVLGLDNVTRKIKSDDIVIIDGEAGLVILNPTDQTIIDYEEEQRRYAAYYAAISEKSQYPAETADGQRITVMGNIEMPEEAESIITYGGDGIGLFRTEFLYLKRRTFPSEEDLFSQYQKVVSTMPHGRVVIRTLDINGDKAVNKQSAPREANPALGMRAIRFCLKRPDVFKSQLRAILRAAMHGDVHVMFPMISSCGEVKAAKKLLEESARSLEKDKIPFRSDIKVGIMIEIPSAVIMADALADTVDFFSIGTNDLVQYSLAIDRANKDVAHLYRPLHPAVLRMIRQVVTVGRDKGIDVFMCGEMAGDPYNMPILLGLGMRAFSMTPQSIPAVKNVIHQVKMADAEAVADEALKLSEADAIDRLVQETYGALVSEENLAH